MPILDVIFLPSLQVDDYSVRRTLAFLVEFEISMVMVTRRGPSLHIIHRHS
jgi:hypothetical protein